MVPTTRRRLLHGATALLAGLAGCSGSSEFSSSSPPERPENVALDPEHVSLRGDDEWPVAWFGSEREGGSGNADGDREGAASPARSHAHRLIADDATAKTLSFADVDGVEAARTFVADTDFESETLYVEGKTVGECYRPVLCYVTWSEREVRTDYARVLRDYDVPCEADDEQSVAHVIRIPDALDPDEVRGYGSGYGSGGCRIPPPLQESANATNDGTAATERDVESPAGEGDMESLAGDATEAFR